MIVFVVCGYAATGRLPLFAAFNYTNDMYLLMLLNKVALFLNKCSNTYPNTLLYNYL